MPYANRWILILLGVLCWNVGSAMASEPVLQISHFGVKVEHVGFLDDSAEQQDVDSGLFLGVEAYEYLDHGVYYGFEAGWADIEGNIVENGSEYDTELTYIPVEMNVKWVGLILPYTSLGVGLGPSMGYARHEVKGSGIDESKEDWFWGGQALAELNIEAGAIYFGLNGKYQAVEKDLQNWRAGAHIGCRF